ncbi:contractile injection system protein, VgrG/Pvc8 family [Celerinatantimonas sp. MCCC 1A17872]|uniref:contractile injection system protein, VgrG/Pvc8 family n=1 Tax=Celerinatantimonas sp. MCCC 1A17872 TaxID=3177514 RepID=UPI0038BECC1D
MALTNPQPICKLTVNGTDMTSTLQPRLVSLSLTDNRDLTADTLTVTLSDDDGLLVLPPTNAVLQLWLGWSDSGLTYKGSYTVDEVEHSGTPDLLHIRARSADLSGAFKTKREQSWHGVTLGSVLSVIAQRYSLKQAISASLASITLEHLDQTRESDANLLSRLGQHYGAVATIKNNHLLFLPNGQSQNLSGIALPTITLNRQDGDQHRYMLAKRGSYTGVKAYYYRTDQAKRLTTIAGTGDDYKELRHSYTDQASALAAARAEWQRLQQGSASLTFTLARGRPDLIPEQTYRINGIKLQISAIIWLGGNVRHQFGPQSYTTELSLTTQTPQNLIDSHPDTFSGVMAWYLDANNQQKSVTAGSGPNYKHLSYLYASENNAKRAAQREWGKLKG